MASAVLGVLAQALLCAMMLSVMANAALATTARLAVAAQHRAHAPQVSMAAHLAWIHLLVAASVVWGTGVALLLPAPHRMHAPQVPLVTQLA